jgi:hypothetical protein
MPEKIWKGRFTERNDICDHLAARAVVNRRAGQGATGKGAVQAGIEAAEKRLA